MKTERRHELQTNVLADWIGLQVERFRPYSRLALGVLVAIIVAIGLYGYLNTQASYRNEEGWQRYFVAMDDLQQKGDIDPLTQIAQSSEFANTPVGYWSILSLADHHLREGIGQLFNDRPAATTSLRAAVDEYLRVAGQTKFPMLAERAKLGVGNAFESLNELDKARSAYESLAASGSGPFALEAQQRLRDLGREPTKRFYDWFFAATPPRQTLGGPGMPGLRPDFGKMPDERSFTPAKTDSDSLLSTPAKTEEGAAADATPAQDAAPSDSAAPAETPTTPDSATGTAPEGDAKADAPAAGDQKSPEAATP
jgi:hypothetical protein